MKVFPMLNPASIGYGLVGVDITYEGNVYSVKIYPRVVHTIKAINSRLKANFPMTMGGYVGKVKAMQASTDFLDTRESEDLGRSRFGSA